jgi:CubicO group peptidase (beta-lactamase class C family)
MQLEGRAAKPLAPPEKLAESAGVLRKGGEAAAGMKPGSVQRIRELLGDWAKADPHGFVVVLARRGVIFLHESFNGFKPDSHFWPASIGKSIGGLLFARAVDQKLVELDQPVGSVSPAWADAHTAKVTFRHLFNHVAGLEGHGSHGGLFNAYLDEALAIQDARFAKPLTTFVYNGDDMNLTGKALELVTGQSIFRLLHENLQRPFAEDVTQFDLGAGDAFNAMYLAKVGQMLIQDGAYGAHRLYSPGFLPHLLPRRIADHAPEVADKNAEWGIGLTWMTGPGERAKSPLGPNVVGHGAASGTVWRIALDHQLVAVVGRYEFKDGGEHEAWTEKLMTRLAEDLQR